MFMILTAPLITMTITIIVMPLVSLLQKNMIDREKSSSFKCGFTPNHRLEFPSLFASC